MSRWTVFVATGLVLSGCGGAPTTISINLAPDAGKDVHDAAVNEDAQTIEADGANPIPDAGSDVVFDGGTGAPDADVCPGALATTESLTSASCFAFGPDGVCPPCAPYGFGCGAEDIPEGLPLDGVHRAGDRWCAPAARCVRLSQDDADCAAIPNSGTPHAYSCSTGADGGNVALHPTARCREMQASGRTVTCCE